MKKIKLDFSNTNVDKSKPTISISKVLEMLAPPFDQKGVAEKTYNKHFNNPDSQYYQKSIDEIIDMWSAKGAESCRYGSLLDDYIGTVLTKTDDDLLMFKLDNNYDYDMRLNGLCNSFDNFKSVFLASGEWVLVDREQTVYYYVEEFDYYIKGRFDALFYNTITKKWLVVDWKSSGEITKTNRWEKLKGPAMKYDSCNYNTYTIQVQHYKKTLFEMGYLPEGTSIDDIDVMIVHMPGHIIEGLDTDFETCKQAFPYNSEFLGQVYSFAIRKNILLTATKNEA